MESGISPVHLRHWVRNPPGGLKLKVATMEEGGALLINLLQLYRSLRYVWLDVWLTRSSTQGGLGHGKTALGRILIWFDGLNSAEIEIRQPVTVHWGFPRFSPAVRRVVLMWLSVGAVSGGFFGRHQVK